MKLSEEELKQIQRNFKGVTGWQAVDGLLAHIESQEQEIGRLKEALTGLVEIGKRDTTNPKYDPYWDFAREVLAQPEASGKDDGRTKCSGCFMRFLKKNLTEIDGCNWCPDCAKEVKHD